MRHKINSWAEQTNLLDKSGFLFRVISLLLLTSSFNIIMVHCTEKMVETETGTYANNTTTSLITRTTRFARSTTLENLHKPVFKNCKDFGDNDYVHFLEEGPINTIVYQVQITESDSVSKVGLVTFTIVSGNKTNDKFIIDPETGVIRTNKIFDRDEPKREKEEFVTVRATNRGRPRLYSDCTLNISIVGIDDNLPSFARSDYNVSFNWFVDVGHVVTRISATYLDYYYYRKEPSYKLENSAVGNDYFDSFEILEETGKVILKNSIPYSLELEERIRNFIPIQFRVVAFDRLNASRSATTNLTLYLQNNTWIEPPVFQQYQDIFNLPEIGWNKSMPVETFSVYSGANTIDHEMATGLVFFDIVIGPTDATNKGGTFLIENIGNNKAHLKLNKDLDYEIVSEYILTITVTNEEFFVNETYLTIRVEDVNDEMPEFTELRLGIVLENEPIGTFVMRVQAIDKDFMDLYKEVIYTLKEEYRENFEINNITGEIRTRQKFDREVKDTYYVTVIAQDGAPSALRSDGRPNSQSIVVQIEIADRNDNAPMFVKSNYEIEIYEDVGIGSEVITVKTVDKDIASEIEYSFAEGNGEGSVGDAFNITSLGGILFVKNRLDYEKTRDVRYHLTLEASDSIHKAYADVHIRVINVNDEPPKIKILNNTNTYVYIQEDSIPLKCLLNLEAYDPDIENQLVPQNISYFMQKGGKYFEVDKNGCMRVTEPLNHDRPDGKYWWPITVGAYDEWGLTLTRNLAVINISVYLNDINDNAPFYDGPNPVVYYENGPRDQIAELEADDYDGSGNGWPFQFSIDPYASSEIMTLFEVSDVNYLWTKRGNFDREVKKEYLVPVVIRDSGEPPHTGTSTVTVVIGDKNDNPMYPGESNILVYKHKTKSEFPIGRVFVEDLDDWDLPFKTFKWSNGEPHPNFNLDTHDGSISVWPNTTGGIYLLNFYVVDRLHEQRVSANVTVTVKEIPDEFIGNSGSMRIGGISEEKFIMPGENGKSKKDILEQELVVLFGVPKERIDVFSVINSLSSLDANTVDVRYSVHHSFFQKSDKLDKITLENRKMLEKALRLKILMIRIDECVRTKLQCKSTCINRLNISDVPYNIYTNKSSFVGVSVNVTPECASNVNVTEPLCTTFTCIDGACITNEVACEVDEDCVNKFEDPHCSNDTTEQEVPLLPLQDSNATINPLQTVLLACNLLYNQTSKIVWTFENVPVADWPDSFNYSFSDNNANLTIKFISDNVEGTFKCTVYHLSAFISIKVAAFEKPYFEVTNMDNSTKSWNQNERMQLICVAGGIPKPRITWEWQHELTGNDTSSASMEFSLKHNNYSLFITDISTPTKVRFICKGENQEGQVTEYADVIVGGLDIYEILIISGVTIGTALIFFIALALIVYKYKQQKAARFLGGLSLKEFYEGNIEMINPELGVSDQANFLPFSQEKWEIPRECIVLGKALGSGAFGLVLKAEAFGVMEDENSTTVAVKTVQPVADESHYKALIMELKIMAHLGQHLNVVNLIGAVTQNLSTKKELLVVMEFCKYGSVLSYMHANRDSFINQLDTKTDQIDSSISLRVGQSNKKLQDKCPGTDTNPIDEVVADDSNNGTTLPDYIGDYEKSEIQPFKSTDLLSWAFQAAKGMEYLASRKVLHGDLAARNVLLAENHVVKICDFGFAREKNYDYQKNINGLLLPIKWMAIESISCGIFSPKSDCWSFGILLWELFTLGDKPYPGMEINVEFVQGLKDGMRMDKPPYAPTTVYQIMLDCWAQEPQSRPQFTQVAERLKELISTSVYTKLEDLNEQYTRLNQEEGMTVENDFFLRMGAANVTTQVEEIPGPILASELNVEVGQTVSESGPSCSLYVNTGSVVCSSFLPGSHVSQQVNVIVHPPN